MTDAADLLRRHQPCLYYDSQEAYFADSAAEWTDNAGNVLTDGTGLGANVIATAGGTPPLSLDFLGANK
jgi:hypothetical protein